MLHKTINSYPSLGKETELPIFLRAVGRNEYQPTEDKENGYLYHLIYFVEEGELCLTVEGREYRIREKMGFFIACDVPYRIEKRTKICMTHWVSFGGTCKEQLFPLIGLNQPCVIYEKLDIEPLKLQLKKMYLLSTEDNFYSRCQNSARIYQYIMDIYAQSQKEKEEMQEENPALMLAKRYIEQYYFNDLTLQGLADYAHVSPQHLCRLFQKHMHMRPTHYINLTRIKVSKWLLHNSDKTVTEIAEEVGYASPYYFSNTFRKYENMSPSDYRKMVKEA